MNWFGGGLTLVLSIVAWLCALSSGLSAEDTLTQPVCSPQIERWLSEQPSAPRLDLSEPS